MGSKMEEQRRPMRYDAGTWMPENIAQTVQKVIQDLVAPDVRELKSLVIALQRHIDQRFEAQQEQMDQRFEAQQKQMDQRFDQMDQRFEAQQKQMDQRFDTQEQRAEAQSQKADAQFKALMAALGEFKAQSELTSIRVISQLSERVAVLESQRH